MKKILFLIFLIFSVSGCKGLNRLLGNGPDDNNQSVEVKPGCPNGIVNPLGGCLAAGVKP